MENRFGSLHYNAIGPYLQKEFGCRVAKLAIDGGFTCPNRDGTISTGGCIFCSGDGGGHFASNIPDQMKLLSEKWPNSKYIAYFQNFSNTYAPVDELRQKYEEALTFPGVVGLAIATRPDCLPPDVIELLSELNQKTYLWVELGLQSIMDATALRIRRGYPLTVFIDAMDELSAAGIRTVVHLIFGLPKESRSDMIESVRYVADMNPFGLKFHHLYVMEGSRIIQKYPEYLPGMAMDEYISLVADSIEILPQNITIHRIAGDPPAQGLLGPLWSLDKRSVLNALQTEFKRRGTFQGSRL
ncbi:TIGR01212 family radical SAM protein [Bacillota bacterium]